MEVSRDSIRRWLGGATLAVVIVVFATACLHRVANFWQWGHNGYNGAAFSQAARNTLRFGIVGQAQYHTGLRPPPAEAIYTHHPLMLHMHLVALQAVLGDAEWVGRLVPACYSILNLLVLTLMVRRLSGPALALLSAALYAMLPINLVFATMIDHEQGGIFWCLVTIWAYIEWLRGYRWRFLAVSLVGITIATQFDWPGYYVAFFIAVHALVTALVRHPGVIRHRPEYTWIGVFSVVVLANFIGFFAWIWFQQGTLAGMQESFLHRSSIPPDSGGWVRSHLADLHGWPMIGIVGLWVALVVYRFARWKLEVVDLVPLLFLLVQVIHSTVFRQAGMYHSYWTIWLGPAVAVGGAQVLLGGTRLLALGSRRMLLSIGGRLGRSDVIRAVSATAGALLVASVLGPQAFFALKQTRWGHDTGAASYVPGYRDQFAEITWGRALGRRYERGEVFYLIDPSVQGRIELLYYLDSPLAWVPATLATSRIGHEGKKRVVILDLATCGARASVARLVRSHTTVVWDRRFVAVELEGADQGIRGLVSRALPMSWLHRWLVNPRRPSVVWEGDPDPEAVAGLFDTQVQVTLEPVRGRLGGEPREWDCPRGHVMSALGAVIRNTGKHGRVLGAIQPVCEPVVSTGFDTLAGPWQGDWWGVQETRVSCPGSSLPVGAVVHLTQSRFVAGMGLVCASRSWSPRLQSYALGDPLPTEVAGRALGMGIHLRCPGGSVVWGFRGRVGEVMDAVGISCVALDGPFMDNPPTSLGDTPFTWP